VLLDDPKMLKEELIRTENIYKSFGKIEALKGINFDVRKGEIRGLVGENGAGKSVFLKILGGVLKPDKGRIYWEEKEVNFRNPKDAQECGYAIVYQETNLVMNKTAIENIFLGRERDVCGSIKLNKAKMQEEAESLINKFFNASLNLDVPVRNLNAIEQKLVELSRALAMKSKIIVLDETTAQMSTREKAILYKHLKNLSNQGISIIFVSHIIPEVFELCETVTVFRDGKNVGTKRVEETSLPEIIEMMTGKSKGFEFAPKSTPGDKLLLRVSNLSNGDKVKDVSFDLHEGEVLGFIGIRNEGQRDILRTIFGIHPKRAGKIYVCERELEPKIISAIRNGIAYVSDQREMEGIFASRPVKENLLILNLKDVAKWGIINKGLERQKSLELMEDFLIKGVDSPDFDVSSLSGGNRQKLLLARIVFSGAKVLLLSEPGKGIDVKAKEEIYSLIPTLAKQGKGILIYSEDINELIGLCHKILVIYDGKVKSIIPAKPENMEKILSEIYEIREYD
jgi:ribose transport system ATP-binding protein